MSFREGLALPSCVAPTFHKDVQCTRWGVRTQWIGRQLKQPSDTKSSNWIGDQSRWLCESWIYHMDFRWLEWVISQCSILTASLKAKMEAIYLFPSAQAGPIAKCQPYWFLFGQFVKSLSSWNCCCSQLIQTSILKKSFVLPYVFSDYASLLYLFMLRNIMMFSCAIYYWDYKYLPLTLQIFTTEITSIKNFSIGHCKNHLTFVLDKA